MGSSQHCLFCALLFLFIAFTYSESSNFLSHGALSACAGKPTDRSLIEDLSSCPIDMATQDYTILTNKCKGPTYPATPCCDALLEFCCPFVDQVNDMNTNCAETMFSHINLKGKYPPGLFATKCKGDHKGLPCQTSR